MMLSCSSFASNLPQCGDNKVIDEVRQQNRSSVIADLIGAVKEPDKQLVDDLSKTLKGLDIKLKKDAAVLYVVEKNKSDPSKFQVISNIAKFN